MKRMFSLILSLMLILGTTTFTQTYALTPELIEIKDLHDADNLYEYTYYFEVTPQNRYQLSSTELSESTEDLVDSILKYPYLLDLLCTNTYVNSYSYQYLKNSFNGLAELETRPDASSVLLSKYLSINTNNHENIVLRCCLDFLLSIPTYFDKLSTEEIEEYFNYTNISASTINTACEQLYINPAQERTINSNSEIAFYVNGFPYVRSNSDGLTTSGIIVPLYSALYDYSDAEKVSVAEEIAEMYGIDCIDYATSMYNCHSYAWHLMSTTNDAWVSAIAPYLDDPHCRNVDGEEYQIGTIVVYYDYLGNPVHSAVITEIDGDDIICVSKWGASGLYRHLITTVPATYRYDSVGVMVSFHDYDRAHTYEVIVDSIDSHLKICNICGHTESIDHAYNYTSVDSTYHVGECYYCGHETGEIIHRWRDYSLTESVCIDCGHLKKLPGSGFIPIIKGITPELENE